ncbi:MAG: hypothetical protein NTY99_01860 [DPANN group archaeon]|nr:hypothetical protein [DPANN group archaeon]
MDRKISFLIVALFAVLVAFSGCSSKTTTQTTTIQTAFVGGTQGLAISLLPGQPPAQIFEGQPFTIAVQVDNKGEGNLSFAPIAVKGEALTQIPTYGAVSLAGIDPARFGINSTVRYIKDPLDSVKKIGTSTVPGGQTQIIFEATSAPNITGASADFPLQLSVFYKYTSKSAASVCLRENIYQQVTAGPEVCKVTGTKTVSAQGAPVKVTAIEENPAGGNKVGFSIKIANVGKGTAFSSDSLPTSASQIDYTMLNKVKVNSVKVGDTNATCTPAAGNTVLLVNNAGTLYCTYDTTGKGTVVDLLTVELAYGYTESVSTTLKVTGMEA